MQSFSVLPLTDFFTMQHVYSQGFRDVGKLLNDADSFLDQQKYSEAITLYDKVLAIDTNNTDALINMGLALASLGKPEEAITYYDKVLAIQSSNTDALYNKAAALGDLEKNDEAIKYYDLALAIDTNNTDALINIGAALVGLEKYDEAIIYYDKVTTLEPNNTDASKGKDFALRPVHDKELSANTNNTNSTFQSQVYENVNITLKINGCPGCPSYRIEIHGDGMVFYRGDGFVNVIGERRSYIDPAVVTDLVSEFYRNGFFHFQDEYIEEIFDIPGQWISISVNGTSKSVDIYGHAPPRLDYLMDRVYEVTNSSQWVEPRPRGYQ